MWLDNGSLPYIEPRTGSARQMKDQPSLERPGGRVSLIGFHKILIGAGILFCGGFAVWQVVSFTGGGSGARLLVAGAFAACAVALTLYLRRLDRYLGREDEAGSRR